MFQVEMYIFSKKKIKKYLYSMFCFIEYIVWVQVHLLLN